MKAKHLLPLLTVFTLVGCNKNLKTITEEQALEITKAMYDRQASKPSLFETPKTLTLKTSHKKEEKHKNETGEYSSTEETSVIKIVDVNNLKSSIKTIYKDNEISKQIELITFYNSSDSKLYILDNQNGYKTKIIEECTQSQAKLGFEELIDITNYDNNNYLFNFKSTLEDYKTKHKKYEAEKDQYFNYKFGSSDAKSFQEIIDEKYKVNPSEFEYSGYQTVSTNNIMKEDKMLSSSCVEKVDYKGKFSFYGKREETTNEEFSYDSVSISIPDVSEYETIEIK